jgi:lariat debranching enzyme
MTAERTLPSPATDVPSVTGGAMTEPGPGGPVRPLRFAAVGDVHGRFAALAAELARLRAQAGPLEFLLAVGDVQANRDEAEADDIRRPARYRHEVGDFPDVAAGRLDLGAPLYFVGGNHEPWAALDAHPGGPWSPGVWFLGRAGVREVHGLRVAYLSGVWSPRVSVAGRPADAGPRLRTFYTLEEVEAVARAAAGRPVDVLVTHDWPAGIAGPHRGRPVGRPELRQLTETLRPQLHLCGHLHHRLQARIGPTTVLCLGHIRSGADAVAAVERGPDGRLTVLGPGSSAA